MVALVSERKCKKSERGQGLVEFAIGLLVLLYLIVVIADGARALYTYLSMRDAVQEGAIYASIHPADTSEIENRVRNASNLLSGLGGDITITVSPTVSGKYCMGTTGGTSHGMTIAIDYPAFPLAMPFMSTLIGSQSIAISASVTDTILSPMCP